MSAAVFPGVRFYLVECLWVVLSANAWPNYQSSHSHLVGPVLSLVVCDVNWLLKFTWCHCKSIVWSSSPQFYVVGLIQEPQSPVSDSRLLEQLVSNGDSDLQLSSYRSLSCDNQHHFDTSLWALVFTSVCLSLVHGAYKSWKVMESHGKIQIQISQAWKVKKLGLGPGRWWK